MHDCCGCHRPGGYCPCCGRWLGHWPYARPWPYPYPWPYTAPPPWWYPKYRYVTPEPSITSVAHGEAHRAAALL